MNALDSMIREVIRDEVRRLVRAEALAANANESPAIDAEEEMELRKKAVDVASRFRRVRVG